VKAVQGVPENPGGTRESITFAAARDSRLFRNVFWLCCSCLILDFAVLWCCFCDLL